MKNTVFQAFNLTKSYGSEYALKNINMAIYPGEIYGIVGENGAGKTTLLKILCGLVAPTSGHISLFDKTTKTELKNQRSNLGVLFETPALYPELSGKENLCFYTKLYDIQDPLRISEVLKLVGLSTTCKKKTSNYSLGMRQRLGLAIALLNRPKFLILDEPTNGLDPSGIVDLRNILTQLAAKDDIAILISSHLLSELQLLISRIGFIRSGELIKELTLSEFKETLSSYITLKTNAKEIDQFKFNKKWDKHNLIINDLGEIRIPNNTVPLEDVMQYLISVNLSINDITVTNGSLENYYMNLMEVY